MDTRTRRSITKAEKFTELAERRVSETLKKIQLLENLANKNNYSYTDAQVQQIMDVLEGSILNLRIRFEEESKQQRETTFKFK